MGLASYEIIGNAGEWRVHHDGKAENVYETKEAAFEAAVAAASRFARPRRASRRAGPRDRDRCSKCGIGIATRRCRR